MISVLNQLHDLCQVGHCLALEFVETQLVQKIIQVVEKLGQNLDHSIAVDENQRFCQDVCLEIQFVRR